MFYRCLVLNDLNITSKESTRIDSVNGTHINGKSNIDEILFAVIDKTVYYIPSGLEKIYTNLIGISIGYCGLKEIRQSDIKAYKKLTHINVVGEDIGSLEEGLFDLNPSIKYIVLYNCRIFHIHSTIFDNLNKLITLQLGANICIDKSKGNCAEGVKDLIKTVKDNCTHAIYKTLKKLDQKSEHINMESTPKFLSDFMKFRNELNISRIKNYPDVKRRVKTFLSNEKIIRITEKYAKILKDFSPETLSKISPVEISMINSMN